MYIYCTWANIYFMSSVYYLSPGRFLYVYFNCMSFSFSLCLRWQLSWCSVSVLQPGPGLWVIHLSMSLCLGIKVQWDLKCLPLHSHNVNSCSVGHTEYTYGAILPSFWGGMFIVLVFRCVIMIIDFHSLPINKSHIHTGLHILWWDARNE